MLALDSSWTQELLQTPKTAHSGTERLPGSSTYFQILFLSQPKQLETQHLSTVCVESFFSGIWGTKNISAFLQGYWHWFRSPLTPFTSESCNYKKKQITILKSLFTLWKPPQKFNLVCSFYKISTRYMTSCSLDKWSRHLTQRENSTLFRCTSLMRKTTLCVIIVQGNLRV